MLPLTKSRRIDFETSLDGIATLVFIFSFIATKSFPLRLNAISNSILCDLNDFSLVIYAPCPDLKVLRNQMFLCAFERSESMGAERDA
jgi:hypothetical protein